MAVTPDYNGVQAEFRANNLFKQLTIRSAYTYSKTLDNVSEIFCTGGRWKYHFRGTESFQHQCR